ncbi:MAG: glycosyltransferase family 39 protein [Alphaproteobacteria bacterium]|nr:glycosyltransferase family 39 protein [Alphaproteobacteria bacterium]
MTDLVSTGTRLGRALDWRLGLALCCALGLALRLVGFGEGSITHTEMLNPGLGLVDGLSEPPPRHTLADTLRFHFHVEPHPVGYFVAMLGWTKLAGTSEAALRLPSLVFGLLSIPLIFLIGRRAFGTSVALVAAALLAVHGFHVQWSQLARMYMPGACLGLLSTWLLLLLAEARAPRPWLERAYVLTAIVGVQTVELFWPLLGIHAGWLALTTPVREGLSRRMLLRPSSVAPVRLLQVQSIALMLAGPALSHGVYRARHSTAAEEPTANFILEYFNFGFLYAKNLFSLPQVALAPLLTVVLVAVTLALVAAGWRAGAPSGSRPEAGPALPRWIPVLAAVAGSAAMLALAGLARNRNLPMAAVSLLPILALAMPSLALASQALMRRALPRAMSWLDGCEPKALLLALIGIAAPVLLYLMSFVVTVLAPRAFLLFVPYLVLLCAAGIVALCRRFGRATAALLSFAVLAIFAGGLVFQSRVPTSPIDYKSLAARVAALSRPDDLIFVHKRSWTDTPFYYYWSDANFVGENYPEALAAHPRARVWLLTWPHEDEPFPPAVVPRTALKDYEIETTVTARRAKAELYVPPGR